MCYNFPQWMFNVMLEIACYSIVLNFIINYKLHSVLQINVLNGKLLQCFEDYVIFLKIIVLVQIH